MEEGFAPPYFSERTRRLLALGYIPILVLAFAGLHFHGGSPSISLILLYAALEGIVSGRVYWVTYEVRYQESPGLYCISLAMFIAAGAIFLFL